MLDIKRIREQPEEIQKRLALRGAGEGEQIAELLAMDEERRKGLAEVEQLKASRNRLSKEIGALMAQNQGLAETRKQEVREIGDRIGDLDKRLAAVEESRERLLLRIPNVPSPRVAVGQSANDNPVIRLWNEKPAFSWKPKSHIELCEALGLVDFARGAKLAGSGFLLYTHWGAKLERALIQFMLDIHTGEHGYKEISPPFMVKPECMVGVGQFPKFRDQAYRVIPGDNPTAPSDAYLIPTAEAPVANIHREEILNEEDLPIHYCAYSPCFRAEAGAAGVGTRGMIRVHQFDKVELIRIVRPEESDAALEQLVQHAETILQRLGLHYRVIQLCTGDLGFSSAITYDIEIWAPGQGNYLEVSSCSNCEDFQARRMNLRYKTGDGRKIFPHILNGSGTALARLFVALVECYQLEDGSLRVPDALRPYLKTDRIQS